MIRVVLILQVLFFVSFGPVSVMAWKISMKKERASGEIIGLAKYNTIEELMKMDVNI